MNILITKPGEPLHKVEKRAVDRLTYTLDLSNILEHNEIIQKIQGHSALIDIEGVRSRRGRFIEMQVLPSENGSAPFLEFQITVFFETNLGNTKSAPFTLRVYK